MDVLKHLHNDNTCRSISGTNCLEELHATDIFFDGGHRPRGECRNSKLLTRSRASLVVVGERHPMQYARWPLRQRQRRRLQSLHRPRA